MHVNKCDFSTEIIDSKFTFADAASRFRTLSSNTISRFHSKKVQWLCNLHNIIHIYKVVQIWPGLFVCKQVTVCPGHIWTTLYMYNIYYIIYIWEMGCAIGICSSWAIFQRHQKHTKALIVCRNKSKVVHLYQKNNSWKFAMNVHFCSGNCQNIFANISKPRTAWKT
jgi:hypothetical protein